MGMPRVSSFLMSTWQHVKTPHPPHPARYYNMVAPHAADELVAGVMQTNKADATFSFFLAGIPSTVNDPSKLVCFNMTFASLTT